MHPQGPCHRRPDRARRCAAVAAPGWAAALAALAAAPAHAQALPLGTAQAAGLGLAVVLAVVLLLVALWRIAGLWRARASALGTAYAGIEQGPWPELTVFVAGCEEPHTVSSCIQSLLNADYPAERLRIVPITDHPQERTRAVIDAYSHLFAPRIHAHHRHSATPDPAAALHEALALARGDIAIVLDASYVPSPGLLKQLALPFFDPEVGAVMGRVVQLQAVRGLLSRVLGRLLRQELLAGQPHPREASLHLQAVPDGNTVGGIRLSAVVAVGGWSDTAFGRHTDITVRLLGNGWKTVYNHRAECLRAAPVPGSRGPAPAARAFGGGASGRLITTEGPRQIRLNAERVRPLRLRPMPTLHTGRARVWRQLFLRPPLPLALAAGLALHLMGAGLLLSAALALSGLALLLGAQAGIPLLRKP